MVVFFCGVYTFLENIIIFGKTFMMHRKQIYNLATLFSRSRVSLVLSLPFFSKLDLDRAAREAWRGKDSRKSTEAREAGNAAFKVGKRFLVFEQNASISTSLLAGICIFDNKFPP